MMKTRSEDGESKGKELDMDDPRESRLSKLEEQHKVTMKQFAAMFEALSRLTVNTGVEDQSGYDREAPIPSRTIENRSGVSDHFRDNRSSENNQVRSEIHHAYGNFTRMGKIEFPRFDGTNLKEWLFKAEEFFGVDYTPADLKVTMAAIHFDGFASTWHQCLIQSGVGLKVSNDWKGFVKLLRKRFEDECDEKELVSIDLDQQEVQTKTVAEEKLNLPNGRNIKHLDDHVWEPGGLPTKMDLRDCPEKELKSCGESQQVATFLYSLMQVVKSNPAEFKTFDRKRSDKTLSLQDKQDDEHEQNQVIKLISSLKNRIWEPGGVLIEHDRWKELEKCYKHGRLMRLLSSMWWQLSESRELERLGACSFVDIKTWLDLCSREYKNHMLLLDYHGIEMQVFSCLLEIGFRASMSMESRAKLWWVDQCGGLNATVIAGTIMQTSLKSFHQLRVACLHHTSLGFLYGSLPRPPEENHSNFSNMPLYHETWSCISLRTNRVWDPGGSNSETD